MMKFTDLCFPLFVGVIIGFTQTLYEVTEGVDSEAPLVVSVLMGSLSRNVVINVTTQDQSAVGEPQHLIIG